MASDLRSPGLELRSPALAVGSPIPIGDDYTVWVNDQVEKGLMRWPNTTSSLDKRAGWDIHDMACGVVLGHSGEYDKGKKKMCGLIKRYSSGILLISEYILQDGLCDDNQSCTMILRIAFQAGGEYVDSKIPSWCDAIFAAVWKDCGHTGGTGQLQIGSETGTVEARFYNYDPGATCPATPITKTYVCATARL